MVKVKWDQEEAIALYDLYFRFGKKLSIPRAEVEHLSELLQKRAKTLDLQTDEKFRNVAGLNMQIACIHYVVTNGAEGLSGASKLFYDTYNLYQNERGKFDAMLADFYKKYEDR